MSAGRKWMHVPAPLSSLEPVYAAGLAIKDRLRAAGVLKTRRLDWPVLSVGSLSAGGAGKTPVVIALARLLQGNARHVDVLTRGYGRKGTGIEQVRTDVEQAAQRFGDEPVLIARRTGAPVWVGADRYEAGRMAEASTGRKKGAVHLLDDGFQHRRLERTVDIVLVTEQDLNDELLPGGRLREPLKALERADAIVLRENERQRIEPEVRRWIRRDTSVWSVERELTFANGLNAVLRPVAFCGIARPANFWEMLDDAGCAPTAQLAFDDHHSYDAADVERLVRLAIDFQATGFITTEKDAVKFSPVMIQALERMGPLNVASLKAGFTDPAAVMADLEARLK